MLLCTDKNVYATIRGQVQDLPLRSLTMKKSIIIIGAGISGLGAAYWLNKDGYDVILLEKSGDVGGTMDTVFHDKFLFDRGPNSGLETTPLIRTLVDETGLSDEMIYANEAGNKRYILRYNELHALPMSPGTFLKTNLFSTKAKLRLFIEPFIGKSEEGYYQSIAEFVKRRLGQEFLDYAINPFVAGVYAGRPEELSVKSAFPKLYRLEEVYGGLIKGLIKGSKERKKRAETSKQSAKMFSFRNGMQEFPKAIARKLHDSICLNAEVKNIKAEGKGYSLAYIKNQEQMRFDADVVISTVPSYTASSLFRGMDETLAEHLDSIYYPPVMVLYLGYRIIDIGRKLDGFGFLIPEKEKKLFLGAIWSSVIFPERADKEHAAFTLFIGGARSPELFDMDRERLIKEVINEFQEIMYITEPPIFKASKMWEKAIPQYNIGYIEHERYFEEFEKRHPGIFLGGNYRGGISVGDCIKSSESLYIKVKHYVTKQD